MTILDDIESYRRPRLKPAAGDNAQSELFGANRYGIHKCPKNCGAVGTIVQMGKCCEIMAMAAAANAPKPRC